MRTLIALTAVAVAASAQTDYRLTFSAAEKLGVVYNRPPFASASATALTAPFAGATDYTIDVNGNVCDLPASGWTLTFTKSRVTASPNNGSIVLSAGASPFVPGSAQSPQQNVAANLAGEEDVELANGTCTALPAKIGASAVLILKNKTADYKSVTFFPRIDGDDQPISLVGGSTFIYANPIDPSKPFTLKQRDANGETTTCAELGSGNWTVTVKGGSGDRMKLVYKKNQPRPLRYKPNGNWSFVYVSKTSFGAMMSVANENDGAESTISKVKANNATCDCPNGSCIFFLEQPATEAQTQKK